MSQVNTLREHLLARDLDTTTSLPKMVGRGAPSRSAASLAELEAFSPQETERTCDSPPRFAPARDLGVGPTPTLQSAAFSASSAFSTSAPIFPAPTAALAATPSTVPSVPTNLVPSASVFSATAVVAPAPRGGPVQLATTGLIKSYSMGAHRVEVLRGVEMSVRAGEFVSIIGQSGSGKSTLLHLLGTLDVPDSGEITLEGERIDRLSSTERDLLRNRFLGFIFQFYHLLPELTALENVLSPLMIRYNAWSYLWRRRESIRRAEELLARVGLAHRGHHKPNALSGGEMQRVAIARALITEPKILLADEPTGNLDTHASTEILTLLRELNHQTGLTVVMVTHDRELARRADRLIRIADGVVVEPGPTDV